VSAPLDPRIATWPAPADRPIRMRVSGATAARLRAGHPWLFAERILAQSHEGAAGDLAVAFDPRRRFAAVGLYDPHSEIRVRLLRARVPGPIDEEFFRQRLAAALLRRRSLPAAGTDGYRLVHGESDALPGLVLDRYAETLVAKLYSHAWLPHLARVLTALLEQQPGERIVLRLSRQLREDPARLAGLADGDMVVGPALSAPVVFRENGLRFEVDPVRGQKTGFFLDQRDNRKRVEGWARGRRVLNAFAYTGGFSLYAARGGAREVTSLDRSRAALECAERSFALNRNLPAVAAAHHDCLEADAFAALSDLARRAERFDLVILDPPALAVRRSQLQEALRAYGRLAKLGLGVLATPGRIVLASCSRPVTPERFRQAVETAARQVGRPLRIVEETGQPIDHPDDFAEGRYLKCLFAEA